MLCVDNAALRLVERSVFINDVHNKCKISIIKVILLIFKQALSNFVFIDHALNDRYLLLKVTVQKYNNLPGISVDVWHLAKCWSDDVTMTLFTNANCISLYTI